VASSSAAAVLAEAPVPVGAAEAPPARAAGRPAREGVVHDPDRFGAPCPGAAPGQCGPIGAHRARHRDRRRLGSFFSDFANPRRLKVAVLGATLTSDLGLSARQAVGSTVNVRGLPYTVIGVLESQGGAGFVNPDDNLLVPLDTMAGRVTSGDPDVSQIRVSAAADAVSTFGNSVISALREAHGLSSDPDNDLLIINPNSLIQAQQASSNNSPG
jgi:hypothetical protein